VTCSATAARALAAAAVVAALAAPARAPAAEPLRVEAAERAGRLVASFDVGAAFPPTIERQLGNGLLNVVAIVASVVPERGGDPVALGGRVVEIVYDVWEETYAVTVKDTRTPAGRRAVLRDFAALRAFLSKQGDLDLGPAGALGTGRWVVEARVELNPVSKDDLERTREFIANPAGPARPGGGSRSVLAAMASFLLREPAEGEEFHLLRSRPFTAAELRPR
jgi:hypothetical protein